MTASPSFVSVSVYVLLLCVNYDYILVNNNYHLSTFLYTVRFVEEAYLLLFYVLNLHFYSTVCTDMHATCTDMHATCTDMHATCTDMHATCTDMHATCTDMQY